VVALELRTVLTLLERAAPWPPSLSGFGALVWLLFASGEQVFERGRA
jgi:hypothetical protein